MQYWQALLIGLLGSFHCVGMCGPIVIALPLKDNSWPNRIISSLLYNGGRSITYGIMGLLFGMLGRGLYLGGVQRWVSIALGAIMVLSVFFPAIFRKLSPDNQAGKLIGKLKLLFGKMFLIKSWYSLWVIGLLNGLLPCGLVYVALAGAVLSGNALSGAIYMVIFGIGTIPVMLALSLAGNVASLQVRNRIRRVIPVFIVIIGLLFIVRGLNLGIPYVSPQIEKHSMKAKCCQH
jgi:sulfite exporter TauE/SafE